VRSLRRRFGRMASRSLTPTVENGRSDDEQRERDDDHLEQASACCSLHGRVDFDCLTLKRFASAVKGAIVYTASVLLL
jgi:hypothetical protein